MKHNIAFVGCGYVADLYMKTIKKYPQLRLVGVTDRDKKRADAFGAFYGVTVYPSLEELLADPQIHVVVNLTNPASHFTVSKVCLEAGKHVYSEKPLALELSEAKDLVKCAKNKLLYLSGAPCGLLGETAQTILKALNTNEIGTIRLVYAEIDEGPIHLEKPHTWRTKSGSHWPYKDEFNIGCTIEHAGYYLTWLSAFFGPAKTVTAFSSCLITDKHVKENEPLFVNAPDFSVACIDFESGVVARLTCSIIAPYNHTLYIIGDTGILSVDECWNYHAPVYIQKYSTKQLAMLKHPFIRRHPMLQTLFHLNPKQYPPVKKPTILLQNKIHYQDFCRGIAELSDAINEKRTSRLPADFVLHVNEIVLAIHNAKTSGTPYKMITTFNRF